MIIVATERAYNVYKPSLPCLNNHTQSTDTNNNHNTTMNGNNNTTTTTNISHLTRNINITSIPITQLRAFWTKCNSLLHTNYINTITTAIKNTTINTSISTTIMNKLELLTTIQDRTISIADGTRKGTENGTDCTEEASRLFYEASNNVYDRAQLIDIAYVHTSDDVLLRFDDPFPDDLHFGMYMIYILIDISYIYYYIIIQIYRYIACVFLYYYTYRYIYNIVICTTIVHVTCSHTYQLYHILYIIYIYVCQGTLTIDMVYI